MPRTTTNRPFTCVTCEVEIDGSPVFHVGLSFCCAGCVAGGPCICSYDSPLGTAVLGCGPGERVEVLAPAGRRTITVLSIE